MWTQHNLFNMPTLILFQKFYARAGLSTNEWDPPLNSSIDTITEVSYILLCMLSISLRMYWEIFWYSASQICGKINSNHGTYIRRLRILTGNEISVLIEPSQITLIKIIMSQAFWSCIQKMCSVTWCSSSPVASTLVRKICCDSYHDIVLGHRE